MSDNALLEITLPKDVLALLGDKMQAGEAVREFILLGLYQEGRISAGKAAELLKLTKRGFIALLARKGLDYFHLSPEEWREEANLAKKWAAVPAPVPADAVLQQGAIRACLQNGRRDRPVIGRLEQEGVIM